jgi:hypothetical protein
MKRTVAPIISTISVLFGLYVLMIYGTSRGGEGAMTILGLWGLPLTLLAENIVYFAKADWLNPWLYYFLYFFKNIRSSRALLGNKQPLHISSGVFCVTKT